MQKVERNILKADPFMYYFPKFSFWNIQRKKTFLARGKGQLKL